MKKLQSQQDFYTDSDVYINFEAFAKLSSRVMNLLCQTKTAHSILNNNRANRQHVDTDEHTLSTVAPRISG